YPVCRTGGFLDDFLEGETSEAGIPGEFIGVINVSLVVLAVVKFDGHFGYVRFQGVLFVWERRLGNFGTGVSDCVSIKGKHSRPCDDAAANEAAHKCPSIHFMMQNIVVHRYPPGKRCAPDKGPWARQ